jgi:hypothetical protein
MSGALSNLNLGGTLNKLEDALSNFHYLYTIICAIVLTTPIVNNIFTQKFVRSNSTYLDLTIVNEFYAVTCHFIYVLKKYVSLENCREKCCSFYYRLASGLNSTFKKNKYNLWSSIHIFHI